MLHALASLAFGVALWIGIAGPSTHIEADEACVPREQCCRVCDKGQACGNTCISRAKQCHVGRGCACNASEICEERPLE